MTRYLPTTINSVLFTLYGLFGIGLGLLLLDGFVSLGSFSPPSDAGMTSVPRGVDVGIGMVFLTMGVLGLVAGYQLWKSKITGILVGLPLLLGGIAFAAFFVSVERFYSEAYGPGLFLGLDAVMVLLSLMGWKTLRHSGGFQGSVQTAGPPNRSFTRLAVAIVIAAVVISASVLSYTSFEATVTETTTATSITTISVTPSTSVQTTTRLLTTTATTTLIATSTATWTDYLPELQPRITMNATTIQPGQGVSVQISIFNPLADNVTAYPTSAALTTISNWNQYDFLCSDNPLSSVFGYAVFQGHYAATNVSSSGEPFTLLGPSTLAFDCIAPPTVGASGVIFLPNSNMVDFYNTQTKQFQGPAVQATLNPNTWSCMTTNGTYGCFMTDALSGYWVQNGTAESPGFHQFAPGQYTIAVEYGWGQTNYAYFQVTSS